MKYPQTAMNMKTGKPKNRSILAQKPKNRSKKNSQNHKTENPNAPLLKPYFF